MPAPCNALWGAPFLCAPLTDRVLWLILLLNQTLCLGPTWTVILRVIEGDDESAVVANPTLHRQPKFMDQCPRFPVYTGGHEVILGFRDNVGPTFVVEAPPQIVRSANIVSRLGVGDFC